MNFLCDLRRRRIALNPHRIQKELALFKKNLALQQNRFGNVALPLYVLLSKDNLLLKQKAGVLKKEKFLTFLTL